MSINSTVSSTLFEFENEGLIQNDWTTIHKVVRNGVELGRVEVTESGCKITPADIQDPELAMLWNRIRARIVSVVDTERYMEAELKKARGKL
jgi:hypothetical protein